MHRYILAISAFAATALAQGQSVATLLNSTSSLSSLANFITTQAPDILTTLGSASNITILAPNNEAFSNLDPKSLTGVSPQALLTYHVIKGSFSAAQLTAAKTAFSPTLLTDPKYTNVSGGQVVETMPMDDSVAVYSGLFTHSMVVQADINATNMVTIHVIDKVLSIPPPLANAASAANLTSLAGALTQLNLVDTLSSLKDITVFAPTNMAFQNIGSALPNLTNDQLTSILEYHVVNNSVLYSTTLTDGATVPTLNGGKITVHLEDDKVFINSAQVLIPDVLVANGVVHVIDSVLNPNNATAEPNPTASTQSPAFSGASGASDQPFTSGVPIPTSTLVTPTMESTGTAGSSSSSASASSPESASTAGAPMITGAVGAAALFGAGIAYINY